MIALWPVPQGFDSYSMVAAVDRGFPMEAVDRGFPMEAVDRHLPMEFEKKLL